MDIFLYNGFKILFVKPLDGALEGFESEKNR